MKTHRFFYIIILIVVCSCCAARSNESLPAPKILRQSKQMMLVVTDRWSSVHGLLYRFYRKKIKGSWVRVGKSVPVIIGGNGLGWSYDHKSYGFKGPIKKEGDSRAPAGVFRLKKAFGTDPNGAHLTRLPYIRITQQTVCVDDANSKYYNQIIDAKKIAPKDWKTAEKMWLYADYQWGIFVGHNSAKRHPIAGSCVFIHLQGSSEQATIGCTAMSAFHLKKILNWLNPNNQPILVQLPIKQYFLLKEQWQLPSFQY